MTGPLYAEGLVNGVRHQWLAEEKDGYGFVRAYQRQDSGVWAFLGTTSDNLHGGSLKGLLEETVSLWLSRSQDNGYEVLRVR